MLYLDYFTFPDADREHDFFMKNQRTCYDSYYPFQVLAKRGLARIDFEPVTILCGGNGSGKSTVLNIIADKLNVKRDAVYNKTNFYPDYIRLCDRRLAENIPEHSHIITSDDVFDYMLNLRNINEGIDNRREQIFEEYLDVKYASFQMKTIADYDRLKRMNTARSKTQSRFVRGELIDNAREYSNGESAYKYFLEKIGENGLFLLDEPENSLSPNRQVELARFIEDSVRYFECQFIISTHSPFLLSLRGAKLYDMDANPVDIKPWTALGNMRAYYDFFMSHAQAFEKGATK